MKYAITIVIILTLSLSCTDLGVEGKPIWHPEFEVPPNKSLEEIQTLIIGEWEWYKSVSWAFESKKHTTTPESEGYTKRINILSNGSARVFQDNSLVFEGNYEVTEASPGYYSLSLSGYSSFYDTRVNDSYLSADNTPVDGAADYYVRIK